MFHFFERKKFLIDYLNNFVDIHNHILPGIDDGAKNLEESIALLKRFSESGIFNFICTPHIMSDYYPNTKESILKSKLLLTKELLQRGMKDVKIRASAEHMIDNNFEELLGNNQTMLLGNHHILIEISYLQPSINLDKSLEKITRKKYLPVLAHPERYAYWHKKPHKYSDYKNFGISFQLNMLSLGTYYGSEVKTAALHLIKNQQIDFIATDVHNLRQLDAISKLTVSPNLLDKLHPIINNTILTFL